MSKKPNKSESFFIFVCIFERKYLRVIGPKGHFFKKFEKKVQKNLRNSEKNTTFAPAKSLKGLSTVDFGALDERFSLRSAKPARAVRLRHAPQRKRDSIGSLFCV